MKRIDLIEYDEDFAEELFPFLHDKKLSVINASDAEKFSDLIINNFPCRSGRIQFEHKNLVISKSDFVGRTKQKWIEAIREKLNVIGEENKIKDLEFVLIGDNQIVNSYACVYKNFLEFFWIFFSIPQHTYLISKDGNFLLSYTFEDDLYFATKK